MDTILFTGAASPRSFWDLTDAQLAESCRTIAQEDNSVGNSDLRAEARRLSEVWREALDGSDRDADERERRAALLSGLRKRTIQILVKLAWGC